MKMLSINKKQAVAFLMMSLLVSCVPQGIQTKEVNKKVPATYKGQADTLSQAKINWRDYYKDSLLIALIDTALFHNQELRIVEQEINVLNNEVMLRKGEYLPFLNGLARAGMERSGKFTRNGAVDEQLTIKDGKPFPAPLGDFVLGVQASWELDVWKKLRNAKKAAASRYLAGIHGKQFMVTNLIAEIAEQYYELMALDNLLKIVEQNISIQTNALQVVRAQKESARVTQLAVNRFEAQLLNTQNLQYEIKQRIVEAENRIHFLTGYYPKEIPRASLSFLSSNIDSMHAGLPSQLLLQRPDVLQAEQNVVAAQWDLQAARANFLPSFRLTGQAGFQVFNPAFIFNPESIMYGLTGDMLAPLVNRNAIKATYKSAGARQVQAAYQYEQTLLNAFVDVRNQLYRFENYSNSFNVKNKEVEVLMQSINIANNLFNAAKADYAEVLLTQREALEAKIQLIEIKSKLYGSKVNLYRALGGGWN